MKGQPRLLMSLLVGICCAASAVTGCGAAGGADRGPTLIQAGGDGSYRAPKVPPGSAVVVAHAAPFSAYNNNTVQSKRDPDNDLVLNQVLADTIKSKIFAPVKRRGGEVSVAKKFEAKARAWAKPI